MALQLCADGSTIVDMAKRKPGRRVPWTKAEAAEIKALATSQRVTQKELEPIVGLGQAAISKLLNGETDTIQLRVLVRIRERLGLSTEHLHADPFEDFRELRDLAPHAFQKLWAKCREAIKDARHLAEKL